MNNPFETLDKRQSNMENILLSLSQAINELKTSFEPKNPSEYLTRTELSKLLKCDISTIHNWTKKGKLKPYGLGNRIYYKRKEVDEVLLQIGNK